MEEEFWDALRDIAADRDTTLSALLREVIGPVDAPIDGRRIASMLRVFILEQYLPEKHLALHEAPKARPREPQVTSKARK